MVMDPSTGLWKQQASSPPTRPLIPTTYTQPTTTTTTNNTTTSGSYRGNNTIGSTSGYTGMGFTGLKPVTGTGSAGGGGYGRPLSTGNSYAPATTGYHQPGWT